MFLRHAPAHALPPRALAPRTLASLAVAALLIAALAACSAPASRAPIAAVPPAPVTAPTPTPVPTPRSQAVAIPVLGPDPTPTRAPNEGDVDGATGYPQLSIEFVDDDTVEATIEDPAAKAWRIVVRGVGELVADRLELVVETSDVEPSIVATEVRGGRAVAETDLSGLADGTASAAVCHATLHVCVESAGFRLPSGGDDKVSVRLDLPNPSVPLDVVAGTATWPAEPFVLGPWTDAETFPWGDR